MKGADKTKQILETVMAIPEGNVATYGQIADFAGLPGRARLVGRTLKADLQGKVVPWQRVLRADGKIAFQAGSEMAEAQRQLLLSEGVVVVNYRVKLEIYQWQPDLETILYKLKY